MAARTNLEALDAVTHAFHTTSVADQLGVRLNLLLQQFNCEQQSSLPKNAVFELAVLCMETGNESAPAHVIWNKCLLKFSFKYGNVNFSGKDYRSHKLSSGMPLNFSNFNFGDRADFSVTKWGDEVNFSGATWGKSCLFNNSQWGEHCLFEGAVWGNNCRFVSSKWGDYCVFNGSRWGEKTNFSNASFGRSCFFIAAHFDKFADLENVNFESDCSFEDSKWLGFTSFDNAKFESVNFASRESGEFFEASFEGATFKGSSNFQNRVFKEHLSFANANWIDSPPQFHGSKLHQDTSFDGSIFPKASGEDQAIRAYRTLKLSFSQQQAIREEQRFYALELAEEAKSHWNEALKNLHLKAIGDMLKPLGIWATYALFNSLAKFGFSVLRPLLGLVALWLLFALIYGATSDLSLCIGFSPCEFQPQWLTYSLSQSLPLPGLDKLSRDELSPAIPLIALHKSLSLLFLFLIGLGLRNRFKLK